MPGGGSGGSAGSSSSGGGGRSVSPAYNINNVADAGGVQYEKPRSVIDAVAEIQQFFVFESRAGADIPYDFFTFKQVLDFFVTGFRGAIFESLLFFLVFPIAVGVYPAAKAYFMGVQPTTLDLMLPLVLSYSPILIMTFYVASVARYYKAGVVTRKAIHSLFTGRSLAYVAKAFLGWFLLTLLYIQSYNSPEFIWSVCDLFVHFWGMFSPREAMLSDELVYVFYYKEIAPTLRDTAWDMLCTFFVMAAIPYCTLFAYGGWKSFDNKTTAKTIEHY